MNLLNEITANFLEWHRQTTDDGNDLLSRRFSGTTHNQLRHKFRSSYNLLSKNDRTIIVSCFAAYTSIAILSEN